MRWHAWKMGSEQLEEYAEVSEERVTMGGVRAIKHVFDYSFDLPEGMVGLRVVELFLVQDSFVYAVVCWVPSWGWDEYQSTFDTIIGSFRLLD
jgi:hypothetical protein